MEIEQTKLPGVVVIIPKRIADNRGSFSESWNSSTLEKAGFGIDFVQDNESYSKERGTVRGLHYQSPPHSQIKLVRCGQGKILDVAVDIRKGSPTFGQHVCVELTAENGKQLLVPQGFLHGFVTLTNDCILLYKCSDFYAPDCDGAVHFADPELSIDWGLDCDSVVLSGKDAAAPKLADIDNPFVYEVKQ